MFLSNIQLLNWSLSKTSATFGYKELWYWFPHPKTEPLTCLKSLSADMWRLHVSGGNGNWLFCISDEEGGIALGNTGHCFLHASVPNIDKNMFVTLWCHCLETPFICKGFVNMDMEHWFNKNQCLWESSMACQGGSSLLTQCLTQGL